MSLSVKDIMNSITFIIFQAWCLYEQVVKSVPFNQQKRLRPNLGALDICCQAMYENINCPNAAI